MVFYDDLIGMPMYDTGMLAFESQVGKMVGMCLLEAYKKIANEDFYVSPALESVFLSAVLSEMQIKVLVAGDVYNSRTSLKDMKIYHHKGE